VAQRLVVVGVDCSPASDTTLDWALESAARRGSRIDVVHAWSWGQVTSEFMVPSAPTQLAEAASTAVRAQVERALARRAPDAPPVDVRPCAAEGDPAAVLVRAAAGADALVLGRHGQSALTQRLVGPVLGSVAGYCLDRSPAPVAVVPHRTPAALPARVVVGVDGSGGSARALRWALAHADALRAPLVAVLTWQLTTLPAPPSATAGGVAPLREWQASAERLLRTSLEQALPAGRAGDVQRVVLHERAVSGLLSAVTPDDLLVLGERGRGGFARLLLGSTSRQCAEHAPCPVVVVPPRDRSGGVDDD
jgi:nucleotide-binding universal stress UspA family protein